MTPEQKARQRIDQLLKYAGWAVQDREQMNLFDPAVPGARRTLLTILRAFQGAQVIATHDLDLVVEHCSRVIVLDEGRIYADGPPRDVLSNSALMERHGLEVPLRLQLGG
jgi:cobalt/nickel transport system ATP-binding protein